ncbi:hypothetical protein BVRB_5g099830 [Beta vulgaris subsp. vulgaris]|nr:hypothetical protein BVRB_5g099830 [Beta vulgaris subsp. vulgaris]
MRNLWGSLWQVSMVGTLAPLLFDGSLCSIVSSYLEVVGCWMMIKWARVEVSDG